MLEAQDIRVALGKNDIVRGVSLQARPGELTAIIGPNGSGKTTLLRALTGEITYRGHALLNGLDIASTRPATLARWRGVLPQHATVSFPFTVQEVVRLGLTMGVHEPAFEAQRVQQALASVDLQGFGARRYQELSGGEAQRTQLARVLAQVWEPTFEGKPRYLFLDEPISSLDIKHQIGILRLARDYARSGGATIAILHDLNLTAHFADHVILLQQGCVVADGPVESVITRDNLKRAYDCAMHVGQVPGDAGHVVLPDLSVLDVHPSIGQRA